VFDDWRAGDYRADNTCPWLCVAGYYNTGGQSATCATCAGALGKYALLGTLIRCSDCTNKPASNSYYQVPAAVGGFDATTNDCPW
jgi:hypothetical protein